MATKQESGGKVRVVWDTFSGGEFGALSEDHPPANSFTGSNMSFTVGGTLVPRSGLTPIVVSGLPAGKQVSLLGYNGYTTGGGVAWCVLDDGTVFKFNPDGTPPFAATGPYVGAAMSMPPLSYSVVEDPLHNDTYFGLSTAAGSIVRASHTPQTTLAIAVPSLAQGPSVLCEYQDRLMCAQGQTVAYSNAADFGTFPATNFFLCPGVGRVTAMVDMHSYLLIGLDNGHWWALSGTPGTGNDSLHRVYTGQLAGATPALPQSLAQVNNSQIWFVGAGNDYPSLFTGALVRDVRWLTGLGTTNNRVIPLGSSGDYLVWSGQGVTFPFSRVYARVNGAWTRHDFGAPVSGNNLSNTAAVCANNRVVTVDTPPAGIPSNFYLWKPRLDRPPIPGADEATLDGFTVYTPFVNLPIAWAPPATEWAVRAVHVDVDAYNNGVSDPTVTVAGSATGTQDDGDLPTTANTQTIVRSEVAATGTRRRLTFTFGEAAFGAGLRIGLTGINAVEIRRVTAIVEQRGIDY